MPENDSTYQLGEGTANSLGSAYYVDYSATTLVYIASLSSTAAPFLLPAAMLLASYLLASKVAQQSDQAEDSMLASPYQLGYDMGFQYFQDSAKQKQDGVGRAFRPHTQPQLDWAVVFSLHLNWAWWIGGNNPSGLPIENVTADPEKHITAEMNPWAALSLAGNLQGGANGMLSCHTDISEIHYQHVSGSLRIKKGGAWAHEQLHQGLQQAFVSAKNPEDVAAGFASAYDQAVVSVPAGVMQAIPPINVIRRVMTQVALVPLAPIFTLIILNLLYALIRGILAAKAMLALSKGQRVRDAQVRLSLTAVMAAVDRIFAAVFPPLNEYSIPTPAATPVLGSAGFEGSAEAHSTIDWDLKDTAAEQLQWERAWHTATTFLSLPDEQLPAINDRNDLNRLHGKWWKRCTPDVAAALRYLISPDSPGLRQRKGQTQHDLLHWYFEEAGLRHFIQHVRPRILQLLQDTDAKYGVSNVVLYLERAQNVYLHNLEEYIYPLCAHAGEEEKRWILSNLTGLLAYSLPQEKINNDLTELFQMHAEASLEIQSESSTTEHRKIPNVRRLTTRLQDIGMGGSRLQKILAEVMSRVLSAYIKQSFAGEWVSRSKVTAKLRYWVENRFARYIVKMLAPLNTGTRPQTTSETEIAISDVEKWQEIAINHLGALRTQELFNIIVDWENDSRGAIEDLKRYVTNTAARTHVTNSFCEVLSRRLLQPGAATTEILQVYISIIRAFSLLDPKGVLLDRVARPIRRYLRDRDDTVVIVVSSLLADEEEASSSTDILPELAEEMQNSTTLTAQDDDDVDLDFDDMEWVPDPVDAGPDYKKSKHLDVIGSLISLFETKDIFVKEFQKVLGERLLKQAQDFEKEVRVLELLKLRFGEAPLQACEVMLRDIVDSRRVDHVIRVDQRKAMRQGSGPEPELHARILSHLFWPSLHSENFSLPPEIVASQALWATGFERLKQSRKLTWLNALGQVNVELNLEDRTVTETVQTWQASVIYAFQEEELGHAQPVTKTVQQLMTTLSMSESFVRNALTFWVGKLVLRPSSSHADTYHVLETLPSSALDPSTSSKNMQSTLLNAAAAADAATSGPAHALRSEEDITQEKMEVFWQFVVGMLTNQGAMPLPRIVMMLKVVVPGGFPFGNEELKSFLEGRVKEGKLEVVGGQYKIKA
ncbi:MAG: hypothetical protein Q9169_002573 [Polycauliona sp. 2 TL-2023]